MPPSFLIGTHIGDVPDLITAQDIDLALDIAIARARSRNRPADDLPWAVPAYYTGGIVDALPTLSEARQEKT